MPGMSTGLNANNPTIVSAFHRTLLHQALIVLLLLAIVGVAWNVLRARQARLAQQGDQSAAALRQVPREPSGRRLLRISFGLLWIFDGILQAQSSMPLGMAPQVLRPAAAASPTWVQHLENSVARIWSYHPIAAPASAVWIQVGIGLWLLLSPRGTWSRAAGLASVGWGLIVWVFGEAFGQIFAPGLTWLFGAPGAALFYVAAGLLVALPERSWSGPRLGRLILRATGLFFVGMAVLQAWPGRGYWQGQRGHGQVGTLTSMTQTMAQTPQPHWLASLVNAFSSFDAAHGWAVNLFVVVALAVIGTAFLWARPAVVRPAVIAALVLCLAAWIFIEDLGFLGGVGTDPNSMIPMALVFVAGYLALTRPAEAVDPTVVPITGAGDQPSFRTRLLGEPGYAFRMVAALGAFGVTLVGAAPMALASINSTADPILAQAINGTPQALGRVQAPDFHLVDQSGMPVSLQTFRGKTVVVTFLDDVCVSTCPIIAQEFKATDALLGTGANRVELVAINTNPRFVTPNYLRAFDQQEGMSGISNWRYLSSPSLATLEATWASFGLAVQFVPGGSMIDHDEFAEVIGPSGKARYILNADPGPGSAATQSSFSAVLADTVRSVSAP